MLDADSLTAVAARSIVGADDGRPVTVKFLRPHNHTWRIQAGMSVWYLKAHPAPGDVEHVRRVVDADHRMPLADEERRQPPRATGGVERHTRGHVVQDLVDRRLVEVEQAVARLVVGR